MKSLFLIFSVLIAVTISRAQSGLSFLFPHFLYNGAIDTIAPGIASFSVTQYENTGTMRLQWAVTNTSANTYFAVERSENGAAFSVIGIVKSELKTNFSYQDEAPPKGLISYRVKQINGESSIYSPIQTLQLAGNISCKFYPNPVDKMLIVRSDQPIELTISDGLGKQMIVTRLEGGLKVLDVSLLEPGIYFITLYQKEANRIIRDKLIKK